MGRYISATTACLASLLIFCACVEAAPPPGYKHNLREFMELETSLKRERKIPFDPKTSPLEPLVEGDVGITRVGVTVALVAELEGRGQSCGHAQSPVQADLEIRVCASH